MRQVLGTPAGAGCKITNDESAGLAQQVAHIRSCVIVSDDLGNRDIANQMCALDDVRNQLVGQYPRTIGTRPADCG